MVSVILPAYNAEKYLGESVRSVLAQDFDDFELVMVDDGSTDRTGAIMREFASKDDRLRVVELSHGGIARARNAGLDAAQGEWIYFIDADDRIDSSSLRKMMEVARETSAECVIAGYRKFSESGMEKFGGKKGGSVISGGKAAEKALYQRGIDNAVWGKLFARSLWTGLRFRDGIIYEDLDIIYRVLEKSNRVALMNEALYGYRQHSESYMHRFDSSRLDVLDVTDRALEYYKDNPEMMRAAKDRRMSAHFNILLLMWKNGVEDDETENRCLGVIESSAVNSLRNPKVRIKNRLGALTYLAGGRKLLKLLCRFI